MYANEHFASCQKWLPIPGNRRSRRIQVRESKVKIKSKNENEGILTVLPKFELSTL